jgi:hypothetical protein
MKVLLIIFGLILLCISLWGNYNIIKIAPGDYVVDKFNNCTFGSFTAPVKYQIEGSGNIQVEMLSDKGFENKTNLMAYSTVKTYNLQGYNLYSIDLSKNYHLINGKCYIVTENRSRNGVIIRRKYIYRKIWKYLIYILNKPKNQTTYMDLFIE